MVIAGSRKNSHTNDWKQRANWNEYDSLNVNDYFANVCGMTLHWDVTEGYSDQFLRMLHCKS
jgi:hypothetical protein